METYCVVCDALYGIDIGVACCISGEGYISCLWCIRGIMETYIVLHAFPAVHGADKTTAKDVLCGDALSDVTLNDKTAFSFSF